MKDLKFDIKKAIFKIIEGLNLSESEMISAMNEIMEGRSSEAQTASFITALRMKGETVDEITGAAKLMREKSITVPVSTNEDIVDTCGTGGDSRNTFNISTAASFVVSSAGLKVAKHGNRSVSSKSGSADVMEAMGININLSAEKVAHCIDEIGIGFLFAPTLHKTMRHAATPRKEIGIRTIFNILGPLTNPAKANIQILGVYDGRMTELLAHVLKRLGTKRALVVHGLDGLDEITICAETVIAELKGGEIHSYRIHPMDCGMPVRDVKNITGGTPRQNAKIIIDILKGEMGPPREVVLINAGAALMAADRVRDIKEGIAMASEVIDSGKAMEKFNQLRKISKKL